MILARVAALLVIISQVILIWMCVDPRGSTAIVFVFVGQPLVAVGYVLAVVALARRLARQRTAANEKR